MRKLWLIGFGLLVLPLAGQEEADTKDFTRWSGSISLGSSYALTDMFQGRLEDDLIDFQENSFTIQLAGQYFFHPKLGVEAIYHGGRGASLDDRFQRLEEIMMDRYSNENFTEVFSSTAFGGSDGPFGSLQRSYVGLVGRFESGDFKFYPKLLFGLTIIYTDYVEVDLKGRGTNEYQRVRIETLDITQTIPTGAGGLGVTYPIHEALHVQLDVLYSYFQSDFTFRERSENLVSGESTDTFTLYRSDIHNLAGFLGLRLDF